MTVSLVEGMLRRIGRSQCPLLASFGPISNEQDGAEPIRRIHAGRTAAFTGFCLESRHSAYGPRRKLCPAVGSTSHERG